MKRESHQVDSGSPQAQALAKFGELHTGAYTYQLQSSPQLRVLAEAVDAGMIESIRRLRLVQGRPNPERGNCRPNDLDQAFGVGTLLDTDRAGQNIQ